MENLIVVCLCWGRSSSDWWSGPVSKTGARN